MAPRSHDFPVALLLLAQFAEVVLAPLSAHLFVLDVPQQTRLIVDFSDVENLNIHRVSDGPRQLGSGWVGALTIRVKRPPILDWKSGLPQRQVVLVLFEHFLGC